MTAPAFRAFANTAYTSTATPVTCAKPTGTVDGDVMVATLIQSRSGSTAGTPTAPAGWTQTGTYQTFNDGAFFARCSVWWKRASGEGANYSWTLPQTVTTQVVIASYSGCISSGNPVDAVSNTGFNSGGSGIATALSVTTTVVDTKLIYTGHNWDGTGGLTPPTGMTERFDSLLYLADQSIAGIGATGTRSQTLASAGAWAVYLVALKPSVGVGFRPVKVWSGSAWVAKPVKVWSGSAWVEKPAKVWNGSGWV